MTIVELSTGFEMDVIPTPVGPIPKPGVGISIGPVKVPGTTSVKNFFVCLPKVMAGSFGPSSVPVQPPGLGILGMMVAAPSVMPMGAPTLLVEGRPSTPMSVYPEINNLINAPVSPPSELVCFKILQKVA